MKVLAIGVQHARGKSKNGSDYNICTLTYGSPAQAVNRENRVVTGHGYDVGEIGLDENAMQQFADIKFPAVLDLAIEPDPNNLRRNRCVGIKSA